jgi:hypothetical protein
MGIPYSGTAAERACVPCIHGGEQRGRGGNLSLESN